MPNGNLPVFAPSRAGLSYDLSKIKEEEYKAIGWWKGKLSQKFDAVAPKVSVNGVQCYDTFAIGATLDVQERTSYLTGYNKNYTTMFNSLKAISDGTFKFERDGEFVYFLNLDFTGIRTGTDGPNDIIAVLNSSTNEYTFSWFSVLADNITIICTKNEPGYSIISVAIDTGSGTYVGSILGINVYAILTLGRDRIVNDMTELLGYLGMNDSDVDEVYAVYADTSVSDVWLEFNDRQKTYNAEDFEHVYKLLTNDLGSTKTIKLEVTHVVDAGVAVSLIPIYQRGDYSGSDPATTFGRPVTKTYDSSSNEVTSQSNDFTLTAIGSMLYCSGDKLFTFNSMYELSRVNNGATDTVVTVEEYEYPFKEDFNNEFSNYSDALFIDEFTNDYLVNYQNDFWIARDKFTGFTDDGIDDYDLFYYFGGELYLTVQGLANANPNTLGYFFSQYIDFAVVKNDVKWYKEIWNGLIRFFVELLNIVADLVVDIPVLRQITQSIIWLSTGKWVEDRGELKRYAQQGVLSVALISATIYGGPTGYEWVSVAISALQLSNRLDGLENTIEDEKELAEIEEQEMLLAKALEDESEMDITGEKTFGIENQFLPLERMIDAQNYDVFGENSMFNIKY